MSSSAHGMHPHPLNRPDPRPPNSLMEDRMARTKPIAWYMVTPADGIIELSRQAGTPVNLADNVGQAIDGPRQ